MLRQSRASSYQAGALIAIASACWAVTAVRMRGMDMGPGTDLGGFGWFAGVWAVMMAAMMLPSLVPAALARGRAALPFAAAFLLPWVALGLLLYEPVQALRGPGWSDSGRYIAAAVIGGAALYELSRPKGACLRRCRHAHAVGGGPVRAGLELGFVCIGCCWALTAALLALGVMSLQWMVVIAVLIAVEKLVPSERAGRRVTAVALAALALGVLVAPHHVPGLTVPMS